MLLNGAACDVSAQRLAEQQRAEAVGRLEWLSTIDHLTGLFNRRHFSDHVRTRTVMPTRAMAIAIVDIDHFKRINDGHGHQVGDAVLREVAQRLRRAMRSSDLIARWGGEEFCVLLGAVEDDDDMEREPSACARPSPRCRSSSPGSAPITITVSVGVAASAADDAPTTSSAMRTWPCTRPSARAGTARASPGRAAVMAGQPRR